MKSYYFIGNSLTFFNDGVYYHFFKLLESVGKKIKIDHLCKPNENLKGHYELGDIIEAIQKNKYNYVILQEESIRPLTLSNRETYFYSYAEKISDIVKENGGEIIYYLTMAKQNKSYKHYKREQEKIREAYVEISNLTGGKIIPVGIVWDYVRENNPELNLYAEDYSDTPENNIHPNLLGTYLAACVFYRTLIGDLVETGANYIPDGVDIGDAVIIRGIANRLFDYKENILF